MPSQNRLPYPKRRDALENYKRFVDLYIGQYRYQGTAAMKAMKPDITAQSATALASQYLKNQYVRDLIAIHEEQQKLALRISEKELVTWFVELAELDITQAYKWNKRTKRFTLKNVEEMPPRVRRCIAGIEERVNGSGVRTQIVRWHSSFEAKRDLARIRGLYKDTPDSGNVTLMFLNFGENPFPQPTSDKPALNPAEVLPDEPSNA